MNVEFVNPVNLDILEEAFNSGIKNSKDLTKDFGKNLPLLLSHISISFVVSGVSIFEAYMLKKFCNGDFIDLETYMDDNKIDSSKYPVTHRCLQSLFLLNKSIISDNDVTVKPGVLLFPSKSIEKRCIVTFKGQSIIGIIGTLTRGSDSFFIKVYNNQKAFPNKSKQDIINDLLIDIFVKEFYSYVGYKIQYIDILTDSILDFNYLKYAKDDTNNLVSLSHINSIYGDIQFINTTNEIYTTSLNTISNTKKELGFDDKGSIMNTTEIFFLCNTSMYTFMEASIYLPIGSIVESTDIKIVYSSDQYIIPKEMAKYQARVTSIIEKMHSERLSANEKDIDSYNLIPLNTRVQYTVKFKLSEISDILLRWENKIVNDKIYGDENNYLSKEILKVVTNMKNYAIAAYKVIM